MPGFFDVVPDQCHTMLELLMLVIFHLMKSSPKKKDLNEYIVDIDIL